jgi:hypothetical protein
MPAENPVPEIPGEVLPVTEQVAILTELRQCQPANFNRLVAVGFNGRMLQDLLRFQALLTPPSGVNYPLVNELIATKPEAVLAKPKTTGFIRRTTHILDEAILNSEQLADYRANQAGIDAGVSHWREMLHQSIWFRRNLNYINSWYQGEVGKELMLPEPAEVLLGRINEGSGRDGEFNGLGGIIDGVAIIATSMPPAKDLLKSGFRYNYITSGHLSTLSHEYAHLVFEYKLGSVFKDVLKNEKREIFEAYHVFTEVFSHLCQFEFERQHPNSRLAAGNSAEQKAEALRHPMMERMNPFNRVYATALGILDKIKGHDFKLAAPAMLNALSRMGHTSESLYEIKMDTPEFDQLVRDFRTEFEKQLLMIKG